MPVRKRGNNRITECLLWRPNIVDEGDNFLIELALAGNAAHIVTNNIGDLQNAELNFPGLTIVKPEKLLRGE